MLWRRSSNTQSAGQNTAASDSCFSSPASVGAVVKSPHHRFISEPLKIHLSLNIYACTLCIFYILEYKYCMRTLYFFSNKQYYSILESYESVNNLSPCVSNQMCYACYFRDKLLMSSWACERWIITIFFISFLRRLFAHVFRYLCTFQCIMILRKDHDHEPAKLGRRLPPEILHVLPVKYRITLTNIETSVQTLNIDKCDKL